MKNLKLFELMFVCPDMKTQQDAMTIQEMLDSQPGIEDVDIDLPMRRVRVVCADSDSDVDVRRHLSQAGFPPED
jgi:hypothetical protein